MALVLRGARGVLRDRVPDHRPGGDLRRVGPRQGLLGQDAPVPPLRRVPPGRPRGRGRGPVRERGHARRGGPLPRARGSRLPGLQRAVRPGRGLRVLPDVPDLDRAGLAADGLPPARDGAGDLHRLRPPAPVLPRQAPVRRDPDRQVLPERDLAPAGDDPPARVHPGRGRDLRPPREEGAPELRAVRGLPDAAPRVSPAAGARSRPSR